MEKEFVPYELALRMKALGFYCDCFGDYFKFDNQDPFLVTDDDRYRIEEDNEEEDVLRVAAPTFSQAFRWFREKFEWQHSIEPTADQHNHTLGYNYWIWNYKTGEEHHTMPKNRPSGDWEYETYEEAELACLEKLIEITEQQKKVESSFNIRI